MSGIVLKQENTSFEIDIGSGFVEFDCVNNFDPGSKSVARQDVTCFSSPDLEPEYKNGRITRGETQLAYNASNSSDVHQYMLANQGSETTVPIRVTIVGATETMVRTQNYLIGGVSEPIAYGEIYVHTVSVQGTGAVTRTFAANA